MIITYLQFLQVVISCGSLLVIKVFPTQNPDYDFTEHAQHTVTHRVRLKKQHIIILNTPLTKP